MSCAAEDVAMKPAASGTPATAAAAAAAAAAAPPAAPAPAAAAAPVDPYAALSDDAKKRCFVNPYLNGETAAEIKAYFADAPAKQLLLRKAIDDLLTPTLATKHKRWDVYEGFGGIAVLCLRLYTTHMRLDAAAAAAATANGAAAKPAAAAGAAGAGAGAGAGAARDPVRPSLSPADCLANGSHALSAALQQTGKYAAGKLDDMITFITGLAGVHALTVVYEQLQLVAADALQAEAAKAGVSAGAGEAVRAQERRDAAVAKLLQMRPPRPDVDDDDDTPNELLYGRAGYCYALDFVLQHVAALGGPALSAAQRRALEAARGEVMDEVLGTGEQLAAAWNPRGCPLMYEWHQSKYLGAAHGLTGIFFHFLSPQYAHKLQPQPQSQPQSQPQAAPAGAGAAAAAVAAAGAAAAGAGGGAAVPRARALLLGSCEYLLSKRHAATGNYPTRDDSQSDELVHWCHGATAFAFLFLRAATAFAPPTASPKPGAGAAAAAAAGATGAAAGGAAVNAKFLSAACAAADVVWARGLLRTKGPGLCHGVAGNGYTFLYLFHVTRELKWLWRAWRFAEFGLGHGGTIYPNADQPYSLFNGIGGWVCFLQDLLCVTADHNWRPVFPGFDL